MSNIIALNVLEHYQHFNLPKIVCACLPDHFLSISRSNAMFLYLLFYVFYRRIFLSLPQYQSNLSIIL